MSLEDPIRKLEAHYKALKGQPVPPLQVKRRLRWYEPVAGLVAGIAAVFVAISICMAGSTPAQTPGGALLQSQMQSAGLVFTDAEKPRRAQAEGSWHI